MTTRIGINGFGRIGRLTLRTIHQYHQDRLEVAAINDITDTETVARTLVGVPSPHVFAARRLASVHVSS